jgi:hypothetical protein
MKKRNAAVTAANIQARNALRLLRKQEKKALREQLKKMRLQLK